MKIGQIIKEQRELNNISQGQLASYLKTTQQTVSNWENNKSYPNVENLILLSSIFDQPMEELLNEDIQDISEATGRVIPTRLDDEEVKRFNWSHLLLGFGAGCLVTYLLSHLDQED
ncbi:helix-turn-helix transcriptional regulator [Aerococcus tenax]|uniref:helix-turn-helix transcriptional regulator n=1 Tax=Aerococcus tenax TaxID=3078812 RepID=UPI0018A7C0D3|nr:helix-turn-helix transcriptional regulator [Aerococcus tenax]